MAEDAFCCCCSISLSLILVSVVEAFRMAPIYSSSCSLLNGFPWDIPLSWSLILFSEFSMKDRVVGLTQVPLLRVVPVLADDEDMMKQTTSRIQYIFTEWSYLTYTAWLPHLYPLPCLPLVPFGGCYCTDWSIYCLPISHFPLLLLIELISKTILVVGVALLTSCNNVKSMVKFLLSFSW